MSADLAPDDHELFALVKRRVDAKYPMQQIANEVGIDCMELCHWLLAYKAPKLSPMVRLDRTAIERAMRPHYTSGDAQRFANWRRARAAALAARSENATSI